ncbi:MAG TPA: CPBP family intramembrane glutamic endopeptidase [Acidobacteriaceae bacterium]|nr:CPBP family intramembrane glutamic endopeptidase [Acidobacteriaceae bacterium]
MTLEPEILPPLLPTEEEQAAAAQKKIWNGPGLLDALAFFTIAIFLMLSIQGGGAALALHWHLFGRETLQQIAEQPRFTIPVMGISYGCIFLIALLLFPRAWNRPFAQGVCWNFSTARSQAGKLILAGIALAAAIQLASNYLPVPKELPVDDFFRTPLDAWIVALFGTLVAPAFEELAFRGFLYPALRRWMGTILAAVLTSIPFALLHAQQLAHAASPLVMVFLVSLVLTAVRQRTGSVAASALVHATYNLSIFLVVFSASGGFTHLERLRN